MLVSALLSLLIMVFVTQAWHMSLAIPLSYSGDALDVLKRFKEIFEHPLGFENRYLGAPFGVPQFDFPFYTIFHFAVIKALSFVVLDYVSALNVYYLLTFPITALIACYVLIRLGVSSAMAVAGGVLYSLLYFHFARGIDHFFYTTYFFVPLGVLLAVLLYERDNTIPANGVRTIVPNREQVILAIFSGISGIYYAIFIAMLMLVAGAVPAIKRKSFGIFLAALLLVGIVAVVVLLDSAPYLLSKVYFGPNPEMAQRGFAESEIFGLRITQLLLPMPGHHVESFAAATATYNNQAPLVNENSTATLGIVGGAGFLFLLGVILFSEKKSMGIERLPALSVLNLSALLYATMGGFGSMVAFFLFSEVRGLNRISVIIGFVAIAAAMLLADWLVARFSSRATQRWHGLTIAALVLAFGTYDQTSARFVPDYQGLKAAFESDADFVRAIERLAPQGAMIYQLPYIEYPERAPLHAEGFYALVRGYLHSDRLSWSYGAMKGREGDLWLRTLSRRPVAEQARIAEKAGFSGIYLERRAFSDGAKALEQELTTLLGAPLLASADGTQVFYRLRPSGGNVPPLAVVAMGEGFYAQESDGIETWNWSRGNSGFSIVGAGINTALARLEFTLVSLVPRTVTFQYEGDNKTLQLAAGERRKVELNIRIRSGSNRVSLLTDAPAGRADNGDTRPLAFAVYNMKVSIEQ